MLCRYRPGNHAQGPADLVLYLVEIDGKHYLTNWPASLKIAIGYVRKGRHNMAGTRYDVWFKAYGHTYHGIQYGENTQLCHCKKIKA